MEGHLNKIRLLPGWAIDVSEWPSSAWEDQPTRPAYLEILWEGHSQNGGGGEQMQLQRETSGSLHLAPHSSQPPTVSVAGPSEKL